MEQKVQQPVAVQQQTPQVTPPSMPPTQPQPQSKRKFPWLLILIILLIPILGVASWFGYQQFAGTKQATEQEKKLYSGKIVISYTAWPGYIGLFVARDKGYFAEEGVDVDIRSYPSLADASRDYVNGRIQGKANLNLEAVNESLGGLDHKAVLVIDYSNGSDGIIAKPGITDFSQVKGKKVAYEFGTLEDFFLTYALSQYQLDIKKDIIPVNLIPEEAAKALVNKEVDVAVTYEPFMSPALKESGGSKIYSSKDAPGLIIDILTFRSDFINQYPDSVSAIVRAYFKAIDFLQKNPEESYEILAKEYKTTPEDIKAQLEGVKVLNVDENKTAFTFASGLQSIYGNLRKTSTFVSEKTSKPPVETDILAEPKFIRALQ